MSTPAQPRDGAGARCAADSVLRDDPIEGTASTVRAFLLVEHPGPWGVDVLRDARLDPDVLAGLRQRATTAGVRVLFIRRGPPRTPTPRGRVFAAYADPHEPWVETTLVDSPRDLLTLDLASLGAGHSPGLTAYDGHLLCVCTHGRHDVCCAEKGRPVAAALTQAHPAEAWEVSHIGGDRFAGNLLVLPHGLFFGRLDPRAALSVAAGIGNGHLDLDHLRGRSGYAMPVQAAEIALRRDLAETRDDAVRLDSRRVTGDVTDAVFVVAGVTYSVRVRTVPGEEGHRLTCRAQRENPVPRHEVLGIRRLPDDEGTRPQSWSTSP